MANGIAQNKNDGNELVMHMNNGKGGWWVQEQQKICLLCTTRKTNEVAKHKHNGKWLSTRTMAN